MNQQPTFFDFAAEVGLTKHVGSLEATKRLIVLCHIDKDSHVLDVGCGVGATATFLAKQLGCQVTGVDILPKMVERSQERAIRERVSDRLQFRVGDAQDLPFEDGLFDAVITESVTAFPPDKQKAVKEYVRVTKRGGFVGLNESTWLKTPPPPEVVAWAAQDIGSSVNPLTPQAWVELLELAGLGEIVSETYAIDMQVEAKGILRRYGLAGMLGILGRTLRLYLRSPAYREFVRSVREGGIVPENLAEYFGYGLFVGKK